MKWIPKLGGIGAFLGIRQGHHRRQQFASSYGTATDAAADRKELKFHPALPLGEDQAIAYQTEASGYDTRTLPLVGGNAEAGELTKPPWSSSFNLLNFYLIPPRCRLALESVCRPFLPLSNLKRPLRILPSPTAILDTQRCAV